LKKPDYPISFPFKDYKSFPFEGHITYLTLDISYCDEKKVRIKKIHKDIETEKINKSKYKIDDNETYIYDNQIDLDIFHYNPNKSDIFSSLGRKSPINIYQKHLDLGCERFPIQLKDMFNCDENFFRYGIAIYVGMQNPDKQLNDNLCNILHQLCKKYLKTGILFTSSDGIICRINECTYSRNDLENFLEDFVVETEKTILRKI
jgi:hypothetical protein